MLLAFDIGNSNTVLGVFRDGELLTNWRIETDSHKSADEYGMLVKQLFADQKIDRKDIDDVIIATVVIVTVIMLYGPACNLYAAWRSGLDLQATYDATTQSNDQLTNEVDALMTPEGVQDLARERGYVGEGETGVVVEGLSDTSTDATPMGTGTVVSADVPWYVNVADVIFQYHTDTSGSGN